MIDDGGIQCIYFRYVQFHKKLIFLNMKARYIYTYLMKFLDLDSVFITFLKRNVVACVITKEKDLKIIG